MKRRPATLISGGTGYAGRFIVEELLAAGHSVRVIGRNPPSPNFFSGSVDFAKGDLDAPDASRAAFEGVDHFVHAAFDHVPGRYRGGEGRDPAGFRRRNLAGSVDLFRIAKDAGVKHCVFLSSRAVYGSPPPGTALSEETEPRPDTLYGEVKLAAERALFALTGTDGLAGTSLRITGVYGAAGPGREDKWTALLREYLAGREVAPRVATEVHGEDMAQAVRIVLAGERDEICGKVFNVSDIVLDRRDLLSIVRDLAGSSVRLPQRADASALNVMTTDRLKALGWRPGGFDKLRKTVQELHSSLRQGGDRTSEVTSPTRPDVPHF